MKKSIKDFLIKKGFYNDVKYAWPFRFYQYICKPDVIRQAKKEISFYRSFLSNCNLIFDIGAYDGHKTAAFLTISQKVVCCEPDAKNLQILHARFRNKKHRVFIEPFAVMETEGEEKLLIHHEGSAFNTMSPRWKETLEADHQQKWNEAILFSGEERTVKVTTLDRLIEKYGVPGFIKIDVEGSETKALQGLTKKVPYLSFESLLPHFKNELIECINIIQSLDKDVLFNIASEEKLLFRDFVSFQQLMLWIETTDINHFEVVAHLKNA